MLTRREHSYFELCQKLTQSYSEEEIFSALEKLKEQNYQSDERFSEAFVRVKVNQGKGKVFIQQQLKKKGIEGFDFSSIDFFELVKIVREKKFGVDVPSNLKEKAKQQRFLQSRGFGFDEIRFSFEV
jgi:regulatory protein